MPAIKNLLLGSLLLAVTGCNSTTISEITDNTDTTATPDRVLIITQSGGCIRIGPNCAQHTLYDNGKVQVQRNDSDDIEAEAMIDTGLVDSWLALTNSTDFDELRQRLPEGYCAGCVDGVDFTYNIRPDTDAIIFDSRESRFDQAEPYFALSAGVYEAMQNAAPLEFRSRSD